MPLRRIAISQRVTTSDPGAPRDSLERDYVDYYRSFGVVLLPVANIPEAAGDFLRSLAVDGLILSGGNDVSPALYGETPEPNSSHSDDRDLTERALLDAAAEMRLPVLCECRGTQFANVYFGGKLRRLNDPVRVDHPIRLSANARVLWPADRTAVNSYHSFGIPKDALAPHLECFAETDSECCEGIFHPKLPLAGIMWHPERKSPDPEFNRALVSAFLNRTWRWS